MTREEAIKWLKNLYSDIGQMQFRALWGYEQAMDEIIGLLSAEPSKSTEQNVADVPSGDLVSRQTLIGTIEKCGEDKIYPQALIETIKALPSADRPKGEWVRYKRCDAEDDEIYAVMEAPKGKFFCNQCGKSAIKSDFCPHCGAYMRGDKDD